LRKAFLAAAAVIGMVVLIGLTAYGAREIDRILTERMSELQKQTMAALQTLVGRKITYARISPSIFQYLEVHDLAIRRDDGSTLLSVRNVRIYYSLVSLLSNRDPVASIREIRILNTNFSMDLAKDGDVVDLFRRLSEASAGPGQFRARVTGANVGISFVSADASISLSECFFQIEARKENIDVTLRGTCKGTLPRGFSFRSALKVQGTLDRSLAGSDVTVRLLSFESSLFSTGAQTLQLIWKGERIEVRKIQDRSPIDLRLVVDQGQRSATLDFQLEELRPSRLISLSSKLAQYRGWLAVPITASGHVSYLLQTGALEYAVDLSAWLEDQLPLRQVSLETSFRGSEKQAFFEPLRLSSANGSLEFEGNILFENFYPEGLLTLVDVSAGTGEKLNARLSIERLQGKLDVQGARLSLGALDFENVSFNLSPTERGAAFAVSATFTGEEPRDQLSASGEVRFGQSLGKAVTEGASISAPVLELSASLRRVPPDKLYHLLMGAGNLSREQQDLYALLGRFSVSADLSLSTDFSTVSVQSSQVSVTEAGRSDTSITFGLAADPAHVALTGFSGTWNGLTVEGEVQGKFAAAGQIGLTADMKFRGIPYSMAGSYAPGTGLQASGSYGLALAVTPGRDGTWTLSAQAERFPLPLQSVTKLVSFQVTGMLTREGDWSSDFKDITLYDVPFLESKRNTISVSGRLTPTRLEVTRLSFTDAFSKLEGSAGIDIVLPADLLGSDFFGSLLAEVSGTLKASGSAESYSVQGSLRAGALSAKGQFVASPLTRLGKSAIGGSLTGGLTVSGTLAAPSIELSVALREGKLGSDALAVSAQASITANTVAVRGISVGYLTHRISDMTGTLDTTKGAFAFSGRYQGEYFSDAVRTAMSVDGTFVPTDLASLLSNLLDHGLTGKLTLSGITVAGTGFPSWGVGLKTGAGRLSFDGGPGSSIHGWLDSTLAFAFTLASPLPVNGSLQGRIIGDRISTTVDVESLDLLILNPILKAARVATSAGMLPIINVTSGVATGKLVIEGPVNDPDFSGYLEIIGGGVTSAYSPDEAGPVRATLTFDGKSISTQRVVASAGDGRLSAIARFTIDHWSPLAYDITLATDGQSTAHLRARFGRLNADGFATGQIKISGNDRSTNVTGSLVVGDCRITLGDALAGKFVPEDPPTFVSLTAETGRRVEFSWPSESFPVLRTTASPGGKIAITYRGDTGAYTVKGTAGVQGGEIYYFDRSFILKKGSITFNEDQASFDPRITARAEVREWDPETAEEVKIYLDADSTLSRFSPRFSSDPPRSDSVLLAMIGAPLLTRAETQGLGMAALVYSDILSQSWILRPFEQKVRQLLNLDMFSIRTQLIQNLVAQKIFGSTVNPLDNTSVSLGKYLGNDLFLEMLVRLQSQQLPAGVSAPSGSLAASGIGLQPDLELNLEWATPFFLLDWTFLPKHPESLFLTDNTLALSWRFSY
jgi:translocation and assembly module TamB